MLHIILLILKIILWILLGIVGLVLLLLALILFTPIRYKLDVKYKEKAKILAKVKFLMVSVCIRFDQETKELDNVIRVFGIRIGKGKSQNKKKKTKDNLESLEELEDLEYDSLEDALSDMDDEEDLSSEKNGSVIQELDDETVTPSLEESKENITNDIKDIVYSVTNSDGLENIEDLSEEDFDGVSGEETDGSKKNTIKSIYEKVKSIIVGLKYNIEKTLNEIHLKLEKVKKKINRFKKFWNMKPTVKTRRYLKKYIPGLFKHILPRKAKGYIRYGFGDPCKTGNVTGYLSLMPFMYQKKLQVRPDFYEKVIEADVVLKGKIRLAYIIRIVFKLYIWKCIKLAKKI